MSLKNSKPGRLLTSADFNTRLNSQTDNAFDFYDRYKVIHGFLYQNMSGDVILANATPLYVGPCNEVTVQKIGTVTIAVDGSLDGTTWVSANTVTSADGLTRVQSKYRYVRVAGTSTSGAPSVYIMVS